MKIGLLEKKVESADTDCDKKVAVEREEQQRLKDIMDEQERWVRNQLHSISMYIRMIHYLFKCQ